MITWTFTFDFEMGVGKTGNTEHFGTCRNIPEHDKIKIIFIKNNNNKIIFVKVNNNKIT